MSVCPQCKAEMAADGRSCAACGHRQAAPPPATWTGVTEKAPQAISRKPQQRERYVPGALLADRYRIVGLLGQGGMGEVYRADDLKLGQPVALKFLPQELAQDEDRLRRLYNEVRLARKVAHPNICRVYDIAEAPASGSDEIHHFMTMEYVDGEDLASLLRRIGRLPEGKAVEIARQVCAGLAAAHDQGVLHRDLKPANIMIDGRGQARITDFGVAALAGEIDSAEISAGTPMYMAPEQLAGREVTIQSDLYALGLLLYETLTGETAFHASTLQEAIQQRTSGPLTNPSSHVSGLDPAIEQVILSCLHAEPHARPSSALAVSAALPGGDPLAAALAAGVTPSPQMVAAAPTEGALSPGVAWGGALLAAVLVVLVVVLVSLAKVPVTGKSPVALEDRALEMLESLGYSGAHTLSSMDDGGPESAPYRFWLRAGPSPLAPRKLIPSLDDPPFDSSGMIALVTDAEGRLRRFEVVPGAADAASDPAAVADPEFQLAFAAAGLDPAEFVETAPRLRPRHDVDRRFGWESRQAGAPRVDAGSRSGQLVWFAVTWPEELVSHVDQSEARRSSVFFVLLTVFFLGILVVGIVLARRNLASGRGDRRGAWRIACAVAITEVIAGLLLMTHTITFEELGTLLARAGSALFKGAVVWLLYIAIEPEIRNRWPHRIVAWARLLDGRFRDPLVGRHILIGVLCGLAIPILAQGAQAAEIHLRGAMNPETIAILNYAVIGLRGVMGAIVAAANFGIMLPLGFAVLWLGMFLVLRRETFAAVGLGAVLFLGLFIQRPYPLMVVGIGLTVGMVLFVMLRYGLLALVVSQWALHVSIFYPLTRDSKDWFFSGSTLAAFVVLILACFGAWVASYAGVKSQIETTLKAQT